MKTFSNVLLPYKFYTKAQSTTRNGGCFGGKVFLIVLNFLPHNYSPLNSMGFSHKNTPVTILDLQSFSYQLCRLQNKRHQDKCSQPEMHLGGLVVTGKRMRGKGMRMLYTAWKHSVLPVAKMTFKYRARYNYYLGKMCYFSIIITQ